MSEELLDITTTISIDETPGVQADKDEIPVDEDWAAQLESLFPGYDFDKPENLAFKAGMISTPEGFSALAWADEDGDPLDDVPSNLKALDPVEGYQEVRLTTDPDDGKVLVGTTESGTIAFIAVIVPSEDGTSSDVYLLGYLPMEHPEASNPDDFVELAGVYVHVTVEETLNFNFDGAPSGNNDFMAFGDADGIAIVVTGRTEGETVNSSQAGNQPTSLAANSNNINVGEGLVITYVTEMDPNFLVPDLTGPEASNTDNIQFQDLHTATEGSVTIVKVGPGNTPATVKITAYLTAMEEEEIEKGADFIPGIADDDPVAITAVKVNGEAWTNYTLVDGVLVVSGITNNDTITFETAEDHNRFEVENAGTGNARFSIGGIGVGNVDQQFATESATLVFYDDGPTAAMVTPEEEVTLTLDESPLPDDGDGIRTASADFTVYFASGDDVDYGSDGPGSEGYALKLTGSGVGSGLYAVDPDKADGKGEEILLYQSSDTLVEGKVDDQVYFTISVDSDPESATFGHVTFTQIVEPGVSVWHSDATDHDDTEWLTVDGTQGEGEGDDFVPNSLTLVQTVTDADGDSDTAEVDLGDGVFAI
ncbi:DUF5801 repeats-in-toxin domain-containing protein, partial [Halomonas alkalisoli]|uniref:DUF5801 repeats-in-toxin domain-containing protein n=1 Tax=Halomonas alkalisoli TaxID=2907158 RepID=UPI001F3ECEAF